MYGGVKYENSKLSNKHVTNELWQFDLIRNKWTLLNEVELSDGTASSGVTATTTSTGSSSNYETTSEGTKNYILPVAVSGHSMCLIQNDSTKTNDSFSSSNSNSSSKSLLIFFGFSEYYGSTLNIIQEYNFGKIKIFLIS
jgi:hypothetical protein